MTCSSLSSFHIWRTFFTFEKQVGAILI
jgi:hypothetical protein